MEKKITPDLSIIICTYNRSSSLSTTISSLYSTGYKGPDLVDILVVANACTDDTVECVRSIRTGHPQSVINLRCIEELKPGKSHALNTAIKATTSEYLCFIDDDQTVENGFIANLLIGISMYNNDIYCGQIKPAWSGTEPSWIHTTGQYAIPIRPFPEFDFGNTSLILSSDARFPSGGNICVRRHVFDTAGVFSANLGPQGHNLAGGEDHEFLSRSTKNGFSIRYLPTVKQLHAVDNERMKTIYTLKKSYYRSKSAFMMKAPFNKPKLYMLRKIASHLVKATFTVDSSKRFFYMVRLAASIGELSGAFHVLRITDSE